MFSIVILNAEKLNSQVILKTNNLSEELWSFTLQNVTNNTYKVFLESYLTADTALFRKTSSEFILKPGTTTVTENEIGPIISKYKSEKIISNNYQLSICVRQKYGPDLGFQNIEL